MFRRKTSAAGKMKAVNILDFLKELFICQSTISIYMYIVIYIYMLLFDIVTPSSIF